MRKSNAEREMSRFGFPNTWVWWEIAFDGVKREFSRRLRAKQLGIISEKKKKIHPSLVIL